MDHSYIEIHKKLDLKKIRNLFIGYLIIFANIFNIFIYRIDILPDLIGYIFIFNALSVFSGEEKINKNIKTITSILLTISIFSIIKFDTSSISLFLYFFLMFIDIIIAVLSILLVYNIYNWIVKTARIYNREEFVEIANKYWKFILYSTIVATIVYIVRMYFYYNTTTYFISLLILLTSQIPILILLKKTYVELDGRELTEFCSKV